MPPLAAGLLALAALVLLPGLLVVRAPWTAVPALSLSFWAVSAWWTSDVGGRGRFLSAALLVFGFLCLLRLVPKHEVPPPPGWVPPPVPPPQPRPGLPPPPLRTWPSLLVLGAALLLLLGPASPAHHAPGARLAFQTAAARLLVWRDGIPASFEPLLPLAPFGAHAPAVATLAADVSALSGLDAAPAVLLVLPAAVGLLLVGLFSLQATWSSPGKAALSALAGLALAPWPATFRAWGEGEAIVALAFALPAAALLVGHASRSSAVAAGLLLAASVLAHPCLAATAFVLAGAVAARRGPRESRSRLALALVLCLVLAAPGLVPLVRALSLREAAAVVPSLGSGELLVSVAGLLVVAVLPLFVERLASRWPHPRLGLGVGLVSAALLAARVGGWVASGQLPSRWQRALVRASVETAPLAVVCAPEPARGWVPALAARATGDPGPWIPPVYAEEWAERTRRPCDVLLDASRAP